MSLPLTVGTTLSAFGPEGGDSPSRVKLRITSYRWRSPRARFRWNVSRKVHRRAESAPHQGRTSEGWDGGETETHLPAVYTTQLAP